MTSYRLARVAALSSTMAALSLLAAGPALAPSPQRVVLRQSNVKALGYHHTSRDLLPNSRVEADCDGWVFVLPDSRSEFTALSLVFAQPSGDLVTVAVHGRNGTDLSGMAGGFCTDKAWVQTPADWTLVSGIGQAMGAAPQVGFDLAFTRPAPLAEATAIVDRGGVSGRRGRCPTRSRFLSVR